MAFTTPGTAVAGDVLTASFWNSNVRDNMVFAAGAPLARNLIHNGAMAVSQRSAVGVAQTGVTSTGYPTDRFNHVIGTLGTYTLSQELDAPSGSGFRNSAKILVTTADASPAAADYSIFRQGIEGFNCQGILKGTASALTLTMTFWVKSTNTGTFIAYLNDATNTRYVSASYTIDANNTWEKKTVTFPADTTGVLANSNAVALYAAFGLAAGSNYTGGTLATTWVTTQTSLLTGQFNLASAVNQSWQVTGVQLELGSAPTSFEFTPFDDDLRRCQRYAVMMGGEGSFEEFGLGIAQSATAAQFLIPLPQPMRTVPSSITVTSTLVASDGVTGTTISTTTLVANQSNSRSIAVACTFPASSLTAFRPYRIETSGTSSRLLISAEV